MSALALSAELLSRIAGWQVMKEARGILAAGRVLESRWEPPQLTGLVREGTTTYRTGLRIASAVDADNLCTCRRARSEGIICAHAVAVGLACIAQRDQPDAANPARSPGNPTPGPASDQTAAAASPASSPARPAGPRLRRGTVAEGAEPVWLHLVFPPNLPDALSRGRFTLVIEAERGGKRSPFNTLDLDSSYVFEPEDEAALEVIESLGDQAAPALVAPGPAELNRLLPALADHPRLRIGRDRPLEISLQPAPCPVRAQLEPNGEIVLRLEGAPPPALVTDDALWVLNGSRLQPLALPPSCQSVLRSPLRLPRSRVPEFLLQDWPQLVAGGRAEAGFALADFSLATDPPEFRLTLTGTLLRLEARLVCAYGAREWLPGEEAASGGFVPDPASPTRYRQRDLAAEQTALARLLRSGFVRGPGGRLLLDGETAVLNFLAREFPRLEQSWKITVEAQLQRVTTTRIERIQPRFNATPSGENWFDLGVSFAASTGERFAPADIQRLVLAGQSHVRLRNGRLALIDTGAVEELQQVLLDCNPEQSAAGYRLPNAQAAFVEETLRERGGWTLQAAADWRQRVRPGPATGAAALPPLGTLEGILRPYQKQGLAWLWWLRQHGFHGILADEMGLGKTLQTLAFLRGCRDARRAPANRTPPPSGRPPAPAPHLVVCPTSLVFNWADEAARFVPDLRVLTLQGADRAKDFAAIPQHDLVITSYALLRRDAETYRAHEFDTVVLDEAQHIKNRQTQNAQAVKAIRARHRLVLTGTPLENSVLDLWSIFDFLMPGYLGGANEFRERYELPITRDRDAAAQERLSRRVRPFLLRRLKAQVAPELPARLDQVAACDLTPDQAGVYQQLLDAGRRELLELAGAVSEARRRMIGLTTLLRLRQACCDLRLLDLPGLDPGTSSAKLDLFDELLDELLDGGHRALVFSQFTSMLALIRERLAARGVGFCQLDGTTTDRAAVVGRFQRDASIPVFLISLKAGGTGLNLTGADTVIHFDPWWNPAAEQQAADRAHRIGQTRVVTRYHLIARGTVEEKILRLQRRKREVLEATLAGSNPAGAGRLDWSELQELLA